MISNGIHHVTAISGPANRNVAFYTRVLGLRMVKKTVNFDDPGTYHFYYGDEHGTPGSILTFFPWEHASPGALGIGETQETLFRVPSSAIGYWSHRLLEKGVVTEPIVRRFDETVLAFRAPDGMRLALIGVPGIETEAGYAGADVPAEHAIRGFHSVSLLLKEAAPTGDIFTNVFGYRKLGTEGVITRYSAHDLPGGIVDIREVGNFPRGKQGVGSVHHIAFRAADDTQEFAMRAKLAADHNINTTEQRDRNYFRSLYFREPGGVLFEIATDIPGFAIDESADALGQKLVLPPFLEERRSMIEAVLPALD